MGKIKKRFLWINLGITLSGYLLFFSDSGFLNHAVLQNRLSSLHQNIQDLRQENTLLNERYLALQDGTHADPSETPVHLGNGTTIIKFDENPTRNGSDESLLTEGDEKTASIVSRGRALFLMGMLFLTVAGTTLLHYYSQEEKSP